MKNPLIFLFLIIFSFANSFGQSKKEQIELLNHRVDSLIQALGTERNSFQTTKASLEQQKAYLEQQIVELTNAITKLKVQGERDDRSIEAYKAALSDALSEKVYLSTVLKQKNDSLQIILMDLEKLKPPVKVAPVIPVVDNEGPVKGVAIGTQTWTTKNLDVATFRNGDPIPEAKTPEQWREAGNYSQPAWCYYKNKTANGTEYGKLYNWHAAVDDRGIAPVGYHIPTDEEWTVLSDFLGGEDMAGKKMKSTSGWKDGNGTNSSGFSGLPGGYRNYDDDFGSVGDYGSWWSASRSEDSYIWVRAITGLGLSRYDQHDYMGLSIRCVKDLK